MSMIEFAAGEAGRAGRRRLDSIDQVRGAVMVLMALDHVRWFFTDISAYQPETVASTNLWLFLTRWVTHYCAPGFFLLAGIAIFLYEGKIGSRQALRRYLVSRGALLIALELTIVGYAWVFRPGYSFGGVIWSLGTSLVAMAILVSVRRGVLLACACLFVAGHNLLLDGIAAPADPWLAFLWSAMYMPGPVEIPLAGARYFFLFPIVPWLAIMVLGYALGPWFLRPAPERRRVLALAGGAMIVCFVLLRATGSFGNPDTLWISPTTSGDFAVQGDVAMSIVSFLNTEKYPPSLQFVLMTVGPILLWLGLSRMDSGDFRPGYVGRALVTFGRVPLFYYVCHLYLIHLVALAVTSVTGQPNDWIGFGADPGARRSPGYGFGLPVVYVAWAGVTLVLYALCRSYERYKRTHSYAWLRYF